MDVQLVFAHNRKISFFIHAASSMVVLLVLLTVEKLAHHYSNAIIYLHIIYYIKVFGKVLPNK